MSSSSSEKTPWRYTRFGSVLLSYDFYLGVPIGLGTALLVGLSSDVRNSASGLLMGTAAVSAAIATLVLTSLTVLLTTVSPEYRAYLRDVPGGVAGIALPFRIIVALGSIGALCSLVGSFAISGADGWTVGSFDLGSAMLAAPGLVLTAWATLGCIQLTEQFVAHWTRNDKAVELEQRRQRARSRTAS